MAVAFFENWLYFTDVTKMIVGRLNVYASAGAPQMQTISRNYQHRLLDVVVAHPALQSTGEFHNLTNTSSLTIRYDTRCYFNVRSKASMSQLNIPHGTDNLKV